MKNLDRLANIAKVTVEPCMGWTLVTRYVPSIQTPGEYDVADLNFYPDYSIDDQGLVVVDNVHDHVIAGELLPA